MRQLIYLFILICLMGCDGVDRPKKPKNLIAKDKMANIMHDLYILNAAKGVNRKLLEKNGVMPVDYIYRKYDIDSLQFANSNTYYAYDTEVYATLIENVQKTLQKDKELYEKLTKADEKVQDSLKAAEKKVKDLLKVLKEDRRD